MHLTVGEEQHILTSSCLNRKWSDLDDTTTVTCVPTFKEYQYMWEAKLMCQYSLCQYSIQELPILLSVYNKIVSTCEIPDWCILRESRDDIYALVSGTAESGLTSLACTPVCSCDHVRTGYKLGMKGWGVTAHGLHAWISAGSHQSLRALEWATIYNHRMNNTQARWHKHWHSITASPSSTQIWHI